MLAAVTLGQQALLWRIFITSRNSEYVSGVLVAGFWACFAAGVLIKGPITPMIGVLTALTVSVGEKNWRWLLNFRPMLGFVIVTVMVLPWVLLVTHATDGAFLKTAIQSDLVSKLQEGQESHGAPPLTHLLLVLVTFWPGSLILARALRALWGRWREAEILFLLGWVVPFWVVIELVPTKLPHYMLPVMPGLAMLAALGARAVQASKRDKSETSDIMQPEARKIYAVLGGIRRLSLSTLMIYCWEILFVLVSIALGFMVLVVATFYGGDRGVAFLALLLSVAVAGVGGAWIYRARLYLLPILMLLAAGFHAVTFGLVIPSLNDIHLGPRLKAVVESIEPKPTVVATAGYHEPSIVFALGTETLLFTPEDAALFISETPEGVALVESRVRDEFISVMNDIDRNAEILAQIEGYNISKGQRVKIDIFRASD
jgi:4-amino-4-deoxy-L-arabinose transferase-like glycosyltransferase